MAGRADNHSTARVRSATTKHLAQTVQNRCGRRGALPQSNADRAEDAPATKSFDRSARNMVKRSGVASVVTTRTADASGCFNASVLAGRGR